MSEIVEAFQRIPYDPTAGGGRVEMHSGLSRHYPVLHGMFVSASPDAEWGLVMAHPASNFLTHFLLRPLAEAGLPVLALNTRYTGNEGALIMETAAADLGAGVRWMREQLGFERVALLGFSGGGSLASFYQAEAAAPAVTATPAGDPVAWSEADPLCPADALLLVGAHPGRARVLAHWIDPAVLDERDPLPTDPGLDLYAPGRTPPFDRAWVRAYREGQRERMTRIDTWATRRLAEHAERGIADEAFVVHRTVADPRFLDLTLDPSDREAGSMYGDPRVANTAAGGLARFTTVRSWLSTLSLAHSQADALVDLPRVPSPTLIMPLLADQAAFASESRAMYRAAAGPAELIELPGYNHYLVGQPGAAEDIATRLANWLATLRPPARETTAPHAKTREESR